MGLLELSTTALKRGRRSKTSLLPFSIRPPTFVTGYLVHAGREDSICDAVRYFRGVKALQYIETPRLTIQISIRKQR
jgi:hypothetical protein